MCWHVVVGAPALMAQLPSGPCLLVEAETERLDALVGSPSLSRDDLSLRYGILTGNDGRELRWYRYSDSRLDGPLEPHVWKQYYPNLSLLDEQVLAGHTLGSLLQVWAAPEGSRQLRLSIRQGHPIEILDGAGPWLSTIHYIELLMPKASLIWGDVTHKYLLERGFHQLQHGVLAWQSDSFRFSHGQLDLEALRKHADELKLRLTQREKQLAQFLEEINDLVDTIDLSGL